MFPFRTSTFELANSRIETWEPFKREGTIQRALTRPVLSVYGQCVPIASDRARLLVADDHDHLFLSLALSLSLSLDLLDQLAYVSIIRKLLGSRFGARVG